ncbi:MAG TPA: PIG-L deacetylase family protein [Acidimicrobiia bacterium]|nr:PIG-L deacetylase family protein [Acidimicrobiia bacterium]
MKPIPDDWERAVAVVAHPDDLEYGVAGAVARWTAEGKEVAYVLATSGEAGIDGMAPAEAGRIREEEERRSAAVVGVSQVEFLGHPDGAVEYGVALRRDLAGAFRRLRPDIVVTTNFDLTWGEGGAVNHADHRAIGLAVLDACRDAANRWLFPELGEPWQGIRTAYVAASNPPTHYVDVGATLARGVASLEEHRVYIEGLGREFDPEDFLTNMAGFGGMAAGCEFAVLFREFAVG